MKRTRFERNKNARTQLYGYDIERYGLYFNDGLKRPYLFDVLSVYAQLYFVYIIESSLIVSNYSIRTDNIYIDDGNFPSWYYDFFPEAIRNESRHAHIIDYDALRLGRKVIEDNPKIGSFEFGVLVMSEIGKEKKLKLKTMACRKTSCECLFRRIDNIKKILYNIFR